MWKVTMHTPGDGLGGMSVLRGLSEDEARACAARINVDRKRVCAYAAVDNDPPPPAGKLHYTKGDWVRR